MDAICEACRVAMGRVRANQHRPDARDKAVGMHFRFCTAARTGGECGCLCQHVAAQADARLAHNRYRVACPECGAEATLPATLLTLVLDLRPGTEEHALRWVCPLCSHQAEQPLRGWPLVELLWVSGVTVEAP